MEERESDRNDQGVEGESPDDEAGENSFGEHGGMECHEEKQMTTAQDLSLGGRREDWGGLHSG